MTLDPIDPQALVAACAEVTLRYPDAQLVRNQVGNLAVMHRGEYVGFIDLGSGTACLMEYEVDTPP